MRRLVTALTWAGLLATPAVAVAAPNVTPRGAVPTGARALGPLAAAAAIQATVTLAPRDPAGLAAYAAAVTAPASPRYHRYLTVAEFARRFGRTPAELARVRRALQARGLNVGAPSHNGLTVPVSATAARASLAFATSFERYDAGRRTGFANTAPISVPAGIAGIVQGVVGLDTVAPVAQGVVGPPVIRARRLSHTGLASQPGAAVNPQPGAVSQPCAAARAAASGAHGFTAGQIAAAYGLSAYYGQADLGQGATIAVYELEPFSGADIAGYQACYGTHTAIRTTPVDGGAGGGVGSGEAAMDLEDLIGLAPAASIDVYEGPSTGAGAYDTYSRIVNDDTAQVITTSWGMCEALLGRVSAESEATLFQEAAVQGQSVIAAAGDQGSDDCNDGQQSVDDPASQPWVTGVGATSRGASSDSVWNNALGATGGGVSRLWSRPGYQDGIGVPASTVTCGSAQTRCRTVPDLATDGDPTTGYVIDYAGAWRAAGGTSLSAPTFAALVALADASPACHGRAIGFLNPTLYRAAATGYSADFSDVTVGANGFDNVGGFAAGPGYDLASGLGAPTTTLGPELCGLDIRIAAPRAQTAGAGRFTSLALSATTPSGAALTFSATGLPTGLSIDPASGRISGVPARAGTWTPAVTVTSAPGGRVTVSFRWTVTATSSNGAPVARLASRVQHRRGALRVSRLGARVHLRLRLSGAVSGAVAYRATGLPAGLRLNPRTGVISGRPRVTGTRTVRVRVTGRHGRVTTLVFRWTIRSRTG